MVVFNPCGCETLGGIWCPGIDQNGTKPSFKPMLVGFSHHPRIQTLYKVDMFWVGGWGPRICAVVVLIPCGGETVGGVWCPGIDQKW